MTSFQEYAHLRWVADFPQWGSLREDINADGEPIEPAEFVRLHVRYKVPSPANPENILIVVFAPDEIMVKFAVPGSHEHFDPDLYGGPYFGDNSEFWPKAYDDALSEYIRPVIEDRMFAVHYGGKSALVCDVEEFVKLNRLSCCRYESWSVPMKDFPARNVR